MRTACCAGTIRVRSAPSRSDAGFVGVVNHIDIHTNLRLLRALVVHRLMWCLLRFLLQYLMARRKMTTLMARRKMTTLLLLS